MRELLPWLIGAYILLRPRAPASSSTSKPAPSTPPRTVPDVAYLYQLPEDGYTTVRVAVARQPEDAMGDGHPVERGIFANEAEALALFVHPNGLALAWPGVRQLEHRP